MFAFLKRGKPEIRVNHADGTPAVPGPADGLIAAIDAQLLAIAEVPPGERTEQQWDYLDRLLDARSAPADVRPLIRPAAPVIPGSEGGSR